MPTGQSAYHGGDMPRRVPEMPTGSSFCDDLTNIQFVEQTIHSLPAPIRDMGVNHGRTDIRMTEQLLNGPNVIAILNQMSRKRMSKGMWGSGFGQTDRFHHAINGFPDHRFMEVMPMLNARLTIDLVPSRREYPPPAPFAICIGIFSSQSERQIHRTESIVQIR